ncbi:MAG TPA: glutamate--tRNA ligase [Thermomicrobiales bacterium]|nr:glutamate--tRNA ligase [Thermomicrobiales bacterium]
MTTSTSDDAAARRVRVRFAPSPTGDLHVGGLRSALFTWLFARKHDGDFILRIEDTDRRRYKEESVESITGALRWIGLDWDEGPEVGGSRGPYFQSERLPLYQEHARMLVESGHAYECFCSPERLEALRAEQVARKEPPGYDRLCRDLTEEERAVKRAEGITPVIRFKVPLDGTTVVRDELRGEISYDNRLLEDAVLLKSDGFPTYHLGVVVDDHLMEVSHVMRGEEWIPSFPLHVLIYEAFGWDLPLFYHLPVILSPEGGKLSKRHGAASALQYKQEGYLPEALRNYLVLQGWSYDDREEFFPTLDELVEKFSMERVSPSPSKYNFDKVLWFNQQYINHIIELDDLTRRTLPWLQEAGLVGEVAEGTPEYARVRDAVGLIKDKMRLLGEAPELLSFFFADADEYAPELLIPKKTEPAQIATALTRVRDIVAEAGVEDEEALEARLRSLGDELGLKAGQLFMPIRVAVSGRTVSPGLFGTLRVLGRERALERLDAAIGKLGAATTA